MLPARSPRRPGTLSPRRWSLIAALALPSAVLNGQQALAAPPVSDADPAATSTPPAEAGAPPAATETDETDEKNRTDETDKNAARGTDPADPAEPADPTRASAVDDTPGPSSSEPEGPIDDAGDDDAGDDQNAADADAGDDTGDTALPSPPRVDGIYVGLTAYLPLSFARVRNLETPGVYVGPGGSFRAGEVVYPWMTIGIELTGELAYQSNQRMGQGAFLVDIGFLPVPKRPLSLHVGLGIGGGAIREDGVEGRKGYGGAAFKAAARYEFFPLAKTFRAKRGGGFGLGPEVGWLGFTPAAAGRPMSNTVYLGLTTTYYFGS